MITINALDANNRMRAEKPIVVLLTRRRTPASDDAVRFVTAAAREEDVEAVALDVDDIENAALLDELRVQFIPEIFVCAKGVVLERSGASSASDAQLLIAAALKRQRR